MPYIENLAWENINSLRNYPIRDGLNCTDVTNTFTIPTNFIIDFQIAATSDPTLSYYISQISNQIVQYIIEISDNNNVVVGSFIIPSTDFVENETYIMQTVPGIYQYANATISIGSLDSIQFQPAGIFSFAITSTQFLPRTIIVSAASLNRIIFSDSKGTSQVLTGTVNIEARNNLRYSYNSGTNILTLDAGDGLGLNTACSTSTCVQSINGVTPDPTTGNISFIGVGCSSIATTTPYTLEINDVCCTPCSGCDDLSILTTRLNNLESDYMQLNNFYNYLNTQLTAFTNTVNYNCTCPS
jgi:hypothetical protein